MITLKVESYCHGCPDFEPTAETTNMYSDDFFGTSTVVMSTTVVTCKYQERCRSIYSYISDKVAKGVSND